MPCVTPIGSVALTEPGRGFYFEEFPTRLPRNLRRDPRVSILGVNSSRLFWLRALLFGRFPAPPAIRLGGRTDLVPEAREGRAEFNLPAASPERLSREPGWPAARQ